MAYEDIPSFKIADYVIFALSILFTLGIGIYHGFIGGQQKTTSEYLVGNKKMGILPVAMSIVVSFESSIMMLGMPAETYMYGLQYCLMSIAWCLASIIASFAFVPMLHGVNLTSVFEYLERRFNSTHVRLLGNALQTISYLVYMGIVLFGPAIALEAVVGLPLYTSIIAIAVIAMAYTAMGGIKAVVWTDLFQCIVMITGIIAILVKGTMAVGGVGEVLRRNQAAGRLKLTWELDPRIRLSVWTIGFSSIVRFLALAFNQASFQRISSMPSVSAARRVFLVSSPGFFLFGFLASVEGIVGYAYFESKGCDPIKSGRITNSNQIVILLALELFESLPGMAGLFIAALFSASLRFMDGGSRITWREPPSSSENLRGMSRPRNAIYNTVSTLSSGMGSVSANFWEDIVKPRIRPISEGKATLIAKLAVLGCGIISVGVSFLIAQVGGSLAEIVGVILGGVSAPLGGLMLTAALLPSVHSRGAILSALLSFIVTCWLSFSKISYKNLALSYKLPPAPTDQCVYYNDTQNLVSVKKATTSWMYSVSPMTTENTELAKNVGFKVLYTLSPYLYSPFGVVFTMLSGIIISLVLGTKEEDKVEERFVTRYIKRIWCCNSYLSRYIKKDTQYQELKIIDNQIQTLSAQLHDGHPIVELNVEPDNQSLIITDDQINEKITARLPDHMIDNRRDHTRGEAGPSTSAQSDMGAAAPPPATGGTERTVTLTQIKDDQDTDGLNIQRDKTGLDLENGQSQNKQFINISDVE